MSLPLLEGDLERGDQSLIEVTSLRELLNVDEILDEASEKSTVGTVLPLVGNTVLEASTVGTGTVPPLDGNTNTASNTSTDTSTV